MNTTIAQFAQQHLKSDIADFRIGDTVKVHYRIVEGTTERIQIYEGIVISIKNAGIGKTFCVRKISFNAIGVERIFPMHSPRIQRVEVVRRGKARKSKLYYLRNRVGKAAKVSEKIVSSH